MTKRNLFLGSRLYHNGGSTGAFYLIEARSGALTSSGTFSAVTNYMREKTFQRKFALEK